MKYPAVILSSLESSDKALVFYKSDRIDITKALNVNAKLWLCQVLVAKSDSPEISCCT